VLAMLGVSTSCHVRWHAYVQFSHAAQARLHNRRALVVVVRTVGYTSPGAPDVFEPRRCAWHHPQPCYSVCGLVHKLKILGIMLLSGKQSEMPQSPGHGTSRHQAYAIRAV